MKYITPKQKAHDLIVCFLNCDYTDISLLGAKHCAIIAVSQMSLYNPCCESEAEKYFKEVIKEIKKYES